MSDSYSLPLVLQEGFLSLKEYTLWASEHGELAELLPSLLFEISHVQLGVHPKCKEDEARVVG